MLNLIHLRMLYLKYNYFSNSAITILKWICFLKSSIENGCRDAAQRQHVQDEAHGRVYAQPERKVYAKKEERVDGYTDALVAYQTLIALTGLTDDEVKQVVVAYEPVWAIGTGLVATDEQANETICVIRKAIEGRYGKEVADAVRIQYGGSMKPSNVKGLMAQPEIDGGLIGGASLKAEDFSLVVNYDK